MSLDHQKKCLTDLGLDVSNMNRLEIGRLYNKLQSEGFFNKYYSCDRKQENGVYPTLVLATKAAYNLDQIRPREFEPYWCQWCDKYHIGGKKDRSMHQKYIRPELKESGTEWKTSTKEIIRRVYNAKVV